ncbi:MAG: DUF1080 domain-containing protein [Phycisphaerae bacterium]|nr:DUF1080 domain-containing protein [Phycisphaerae bacterium]
MKHMVRYVVIAAILAGLWGCQKSDGQGRDADKSEPKAVALITPELSNFEFEGQRWAYEDGIAARVGEGDLHDLWVKGQYGDFILELEYKLASKSNSGILIRCTDKADWINTALEIQLHETGDGTVHGQSAGIYDCMSPDFIEVAHLEATVNEAVTNIPLVLNQDTALSNAATVKIVKMYNNFQTVERNGKIIPYEGSDTGWNPALYVSVKNDGAEEMVLLEGDKPVASDKGNCTLVFRTEKRIADKDVPTPADQWHTMKVKAKDNMIEVWSNGRKVLTMDLNAWTQAGWNPQGTKNKYNVALKDMPRHGYIGLQDHGLPVWFRNVKLTVLDGS